MSKLTFGLLLAGAALALPATAQAQDCDRQCLIDLAEARKSSFYRPSVSPLIQTVLFISL